MHRQRPRPEATLFEQVYGRNIQIVTHFLSPNTNPNQFAPNPVAFGNPTWQSSIDNSKVWAQTVQSIPAGSGPSYPSSGAITCLLLQAIGSEHGAAGGRVMSKTTFVQRLNTNGGSAPADGCKVETDIGKQALVPILPIITSSTRSMSNSHPQAGCAREEAAVPLLLACTQDLSGILPGSWIELEDREGIALRILTQGKPCLARQSNFAYNCFSAGFLD